MLLYSVVPSDSLHSSPRSSYSFLLPLPLFCPKLSSLTYAGSIISIKLDFSGNQLLLYVRSCDHRNDTDACNADWHWVLTFTPRKNSENISQTSLWHHLDCCWHYKTGSPRVVFVTKHLGTLPVSWEMDRPILLEKCLTGVLYML